MKTIIAIVSVLMLAGCGRQQASVIDDGIYVQHCGRTDSIAWGTLITSYTVTLDTTVTPNTKRVVGRVENWEATGTVTDCDVTLSEGDADYANGKCRTNVGGGKYVEFEQSQPVVGFTRILTWDLVQSVQVSLDHYRASDCQNY